MKITHHQRRRDKLTKAFVKSMNALQDLDVWFSNKANTISDRWDTENEQVYIDSMAKLEVMEEEVKTFLKNLKAGIR